MDNNQIMANQGIEQKVSGLLEKFPVVYQFLRFGCIGVLNTGLNFLILNGISKALGINQGFKLGAVSVIGFAAAVVQSYLWNRTWTFGSEQNVTIFKNFIRLVQVGILGSLGVILVILGASQQAQPIYYVGVLFVYLILETVLWKHFGFHLSDWNHEGHSFFVFFAVTLIGLLINTTLVSVISVYWQPFTNLDLNKNVAVILATGVSLFWNFIGYKLVVFKK